jgi:integrase
MLPDDARGRLLAAVNTARDRLVVTWLHDAGFRIGELCGLRLSDLTCGRRPTAPKPGPRHVHICHREGNPNASRAKSKHPWIW